MDPTLYQSFLKYLTDPNYKDNLESKQQRQLKQTTRHYVAINKILFKKHRLQPHRLLRVLLPHEIEAVLFSMHSDPLAGHFNVLSTLQRISVRYFWPQMGEDVRRYVKSCDACQRRGRPRTREPLHPIKIGQPFDKVGIDIVGPLPLTKSNKRYIMVATEYLTRWPEARALSDASAASVASFFIDEIICRHGSPRELLSDQGKHFDNDLISAICTQLQVHHRYSTTYHPQTNGLVERFNRTLCEVLAKCTIQLSGDWDQYIAPALFAYRTTRHSTTRYEPFYLLYGRDAVIPNEVKDLTPENSLINEQELQNNLFAEGRSFIRRTASSSTSIPGKDPSGSTTSKEST